MTAAVPLPSWLTGIAGMSLGPGVRVVGDRRRRWSTATTHCGSGCCLGDICAEWFLVLMPLTWFA
jgi:hypothetical protein